MSVYEPVDRIYVSNPWAAFNEAAQRRQKIAALEQLKVHDSRSWLYQENAVQQVPLMHEDTKKPQIQEEEYTEQKIISDFENCQYYQGEKSECGSSDYNDASERDERGCECDGSQCQCDDDVYDGPDEYITDVFDVTNVNPVVEDAIDNYEKDAAHRPALEWRVELAAFLAEHKAEAYLTPEEKAERAAAEEAAANNPLSAASSANESPKGPRLPPHNPLFDEVRKRRGERKLQFGNTRVIRFDKRETVAKEGSEAPKAKAPGKSILKNRDQQFITPNHDFELVGKSKLFTALGRLYNLCDMPLEAINKWEPVHSTENLAFGLANAFKTQELCWKRMRDTAIKIRDDALKKHEIEIDALQIENGALQNENRALSTEIVELKEKLQENTVKLENETRESNNNLRLAEEKKRDLKQTIAKVEILNLDLMEARSKINVLELENEDLRKEVKKCKESLQEQKKISRPLLSQIKELEVRVTKEQKSATEAQQKLASLERYRKENLALQIKIENLEDSHKNLTIKSGKIEEGNDILLCKTKILEGSLAIAKGNLRTLKRREAELWGENHSLIRRLEQANQSIAKLVDSDKAYKAESRIKSEALEKRYAQVLKDCNSRREEIEKTKNEMEKMGEALKKTREKMGKKRDDNIINVCSENIRFDESPTNVLPAQYAHVSGRHRIFHSLSRRMHRSSAVINAGGS